MAWVQLTEADLLTVMRGPELEGIRAAALKQGQVDPVQPVFDQVTELVRGYVKAHPSNELGDGDTIPDELLACALDICVERILNRVGSELTEDRRSARKAASELLKQVSRGHFYIDDPVTVSSEDAKAPSPQIKAPGRRFTRESQDGI